MISEKNMAVDLMTVGAGLKAEGTLGDIGGNTYLGELLGAVTTSAHLLHHADLIAQTALLRRLISISPAWNQLTKPASEVPCASS